MRLSIFLGDIADAPADAICTSTNPRLSLVMGTGASVRARGGPSILAACSDVGPLPPGAVHVTPGFELPCKAVIHCVASDTAHRSSAAIVESCVRNALAAAETAGCATVAMPILGTGHARLPFTAAASVMIRTLLSASSSVAEVKLATNDEERAEELRTLTGGAASIERSANAEPEPTSFWFALR